MLVENVKFQENGYTRIFDKGYNYSCGYYSQNCWVDDDRLVLLRYRNLPKEEFYGGEDLLLVNLTDNTERVLVHQEKSISHIVYGTTLYYVEDDYLLCSLDVDTMERKEIYKSKCDPIGFPHMTADGRYLNWFYEGGEGEKCIWTCFRIDLVTGKVIEMVRKSFLPPFDVANHFMICPTNPDLMFFSHEGDTRYVTNRLWLAPLGEEPYNIAKQRLDDNGNLIDCFGHESWAPDGKGLYFVKYKCSPSEPKGIGYIDVETNHHEIRYTGYEYWHVCAAPNGKYLAGDLDSEGTGVSGVVLIDMENNTERLLVKVRNNQSHPGHPHPQFNPSCTRICFHDVIDKDTVTVGIINI